jgi:myo-inositol-1(or 4)-monophosphatase
MAAFAPMFRQPAWREPWPEMQVIQRDSVAYRIALVVSGDADAAFGLNSKSDWHLAAAELILTEAGGVMTSQPRNSDSAKLPRSRSPLHAALFARVGNMKLPAR